MAKEFRLQDPGEGIHEAEIREIHVEVGDQVAEGDILLLIETDKAAVEIPSPYSGTIEAIPIEVGETVQVGDVLMTFADGAGETGDGPEESEQKSNETATKPADSKPQPEATPKEGETAEQKSEKQTEKEAKEQPRRKTSGDDRQGPVPASPATRRVARELDVDLREVEPSGEGGRVVVEDVRAFAERRDKEKSGAERSEREEPPGEARPEVPALPDFAQWGPVEHQNMPSMRRTIARRMAQSWSQIPHVTHQELVDITALEEFRLRHEETVAAKGGKLTITAFALKAAAAALSAFPRFNASLDSASDEIILKRYCHIGVALDTDRGLLVPVIRDVDRKSLVDLAIELKELADRLREDEASREDLAGGTFTITNVGGLGGTGFTPIINHPEVAILGLAAARLHPVVDGTLDDHRIVARRMLPICVAFDHRVIDGAEAARFTATIARTLTDPEQFALAV